MKRKLAFLGAILLAAFIFTYEGNTYQTHALDEEDIPSQMPEAASTSVGGWVTELLGHIPEVGETVQVGTFQFQVLETDNQSVTKIALQVSPEQKEEPKV